MKRKKFNLFDNFMNSINGLVEVFQNEKPMRVEVYTFILMSILLIFLQMPLFYKLILFTSLFIPMFAEVINSAIERCVDLVTPDYHKLAKHAKDAGSAIVLLALVITGLIWLTILLKVYVL